MVIPSAHFVRRSAIRQDSPAFALPTTSWSILHSEASRFFVVLKTCSQVNGPVRSSSGTHFLGTGFCVSV